MFSSGIEESGETSATVLVLGARVVVAAVVGAAVDSVLDDRACVVLTSRLDSPAT
jgi:hypothetical protein